MFKLPHRCELLPLHVLASLNVLLYSIIQVYCRVDLSLFRYPAVVVLLWRGTHFVVQLTSSLHPRVTSSEWGSTSKDDLRGHPCIYISQLGNHPPSQIIILPLKTQGMFHMQQLQTAPWHGSLVNASTFISYISCNNFVFNGQWKKCVNMYLYRSDGVK